MMEASGGLSSASSNGQVTLTAVALTPTVQEAIQHWIDALGANDPRLAKLKDVTLVVADLPDGELGRSMGNEIVIDVNAAGYGWYVDVTPADNAEFSIRVKGGALTATPNNAAYAHMDLVTVVTHELGHILGFDHADAGRYAVMHEDLDPGVRVLIDQRAFDYFAQPPLSEQNLLRAALQASQQEAWNKAGKNSLPAFNVDTFRDIGRAKGSIDWNDRFLGGWGASPFGNGAPRSGPNFSDFLGKVIGSGGDGSGDDRDGSKFDKLGGALNAGKYAKVAKGGGR